MRIIVPLPPVLLFGLLAVLLSPAAGRADSASIGDSIRRADWQTAQAAAAQLADPVAAKLVTFYRLQHEGDAKAAEIAAFIAANPDWPAQTTLLKRRDEALANEPDDTVVTGLCQTTPLVPGPRTGLALARCADALAAAGRHAEAVAAASTAWVAGFPDADSEGRFLQSWQSVLTPADQLQRFQALIALNAPDAAAQAARLSAADSRVARVRLALRAGDPAAAAMVDALPPSDRVNPDLVLDQLRMLRKADRDEAALALWRARGFSAERAAGAGQAAAFWAERSLLARRRLRDGDDRAASALAEDTLQTEPEQATDSAFLSGFITLRRLKQPSLAAERFQRLAGSSSAISQARAHYWLARAAGSPDEAAARREYLAAAEWPTTYYGQLAILALGEGASGLQTRIDRLADPVWTGQQALDFAGRELTRASALLVGWGEPARARAFLQQVQALAADGATRSMDAHFALGLGLPDQAVAAARRAGRDGTMLAQAGWPLAAHPPDQPVPGAVALGIIRQESSFDPGALSPSGARGLMQLMPATANQIGQQIGLRLSVPALNTDPSGNMRLGTAYLARLIDQFGGSLPLAIAAYNAGPNRVLQWLGENGDPRGNGAAAMIDWIELIPFAETRNYVQRVIENIAMYRVRRHETLPYPVSA